METEKNILLEHYLEELTALRESGQRFAKENPDFAKHFPISHHGNQDPALMQLIEGVAFLNARVKQQFTHEQPELISRVIDVLYPHYTTSIPSMAIVQWLPNIKTRTTYHVPRHTLLETEGEVKNTNCRFRTSYEQDVYPITLSEANIKADINHAPHITQSDVKSVLEIKITACDEKLDISRLSIDKLRFYMQGDHDFVDQLYHCIYHDCVAIAIQYDKRHEPILLDPKQHIQAIGFEDSEAILPQLSRSPASYRLLTEFFVFWQKYMFFMLKDFPKIKKTTSHINLYFYFKTYPQKLGVHLSAKNILLGCTPVVNLFKKTAVPISLTQNQTEYHVISDLEKPEYFEIYQIDEVHSNDAYNHYATYYPMLHPQTHDSANGTWSSRIEQSSAYPQLYYEGTETLISINSFDQAYGLDAVLRVSALCSNRYLINELLEYNEIPVLQVVEGHVPPSTIEWVGQPTAPLPGLMNTDNAYILLSHLLPNYHGLIADKGSGLRRILHLYNQFYQGQLNSFIEQIDDIVIEKILEHVYWDKKYSFCQGFKTKMILRNRPKKNTGILLILNIIERFLAEFIAVNNFLRFIVVDKNNRELYQWPLRMGNKVIL